MTNGTTERALAVRGETGLDRHAFEPNSAQEAENLLTQLVSTKLLPKHVDHPSKALAQLILGRELGLTMMQSLTSMFVINGTPSMKTELQVAMVRASPLCESLTVLEMKPERCTVEATRRGQKPVPFTWTMEMAERAGLPSQNANYKKYPQRMLLWRAYGDAIHALFSDVIMGMASYEEMLDAHPVLTLDAPAALPAPTGPEGLKALLGASKTAEALAPAVAAQQALATAEKSARAAKRAAKAPPEAQAVIDDARAANPPAEVAEAEIVEDNAPPADDADDAQDDLPWGDADEPALAILDQPETHTLEPAEFAALKAYLAKLLTDFKSLAGDNKETGYVWSGRSQGVEGVKTLSGVKTVGAFGDRIHAAQVLVLRAQLAKDLGLARKAIIERMGADAGAKWIRTNAAAAVGDPWRTDVDAMEAALDAIQTELNEGAKE